MKKVLVVSTLAVGLSFAHHGVASLGSVGLEGLAHPLKPQALPPFQKVNGSSTLSLTMSNGKGTAFQSFQTKRTAITFGPTA